MTEELKAGPELDAEVAIKVMGFIKFKRRALADGDCFFESWLDSEKAEVPILPAYSTEIAAAKAVLEKLREKCKAYVSGYKDGQAFVDIETIDDKGNDRHYIMSAESEALAICLAALDFVKHEGK